MNNINVLIVYALPKIQYLKKLNVEIGTTAEKAIFLSKILNDIKIKNIKKHKIGIYGVLITFDYILQEGDRIEIYRDLIFDPKELRRNKLKCL